MTRDADGSLTEPSRTAPPLVIPLFRLGPFGVLPIGAERIAVGTSLAIIIRSGPSGGITPWGFVESAAQELHFRRAGRSRRRSGCRGFISRNDLDLVLAAMACVVASRLLFRVRVQLGADILGNPTGQSGAWALDSSRC